MWVFFRKHALQFLRLSLSAHELRARGGAHPSAPGRVRSSSTWWSSVRRRRHGGGGVGSGRGGRQRRGGSSPADVRVRGSAAQEAGSGVKSASVSAAAARGARGGGRRRGPRVRSMLAAVAAARKGGAPRPPSPAASTWTLPSRRLCSPSRAAPRTCPRQAVAPRCGASAATGTTRARPGGSGMLRVATHPTRGSECRP